jgi:pimeloyl-ACP methyl ester carboxylesterase
VSTSTTAPPPGGKQADVQDVRVLAGKAENDPYQFERLGVTFAQNGDLAKARDAFEKAWKLGALPSAPFNLACLDARQGKADAAFQQLDRAIAAGFDDEKMLQGDKDLESIRKSPRFQGVVAAARKNAAAGDAAVVKEASFVAPAGRAVGILLLLHDASSDPLSVASPFLAQARERGLFVAAPRGPAAAGRKRFGWGSPERATAAAAATILEARKRAGNLPVVAVGVGRGGMVAGFLAASQPGLLAGVATIGGPFDPGWIRSDAAIGAMKQMRVFLGISLGASPQVLQGFRQGRDGLKSVGVQFAYREWLGDATGLPADTKGAVGEVLSALTGR